MTDDEIIDRALEIVRKRSAHKGSKDFATPETAMKFLALELARDKNEVFCVAYLTQRHALIEFERVFMGTISGASVHPRVIVQKALECNAAAVVLAHNHPSGVAEPSQSDRLITNRLRDALELIDVRVIDHIVVGEKCISFAERGWL